jgi:hypothetical protein
VSLDLVLGRIMDALPPMDGSEMLYFMRSPVHGNRLLRRLGEQLAGELFIQGLMDPELGIDQDDLGDAIAAARPREISEALWRSLCMDEAAMQRFHRAYARRYLTDVLARIPAPAGQRAA